MMYLSKGCPTKEQGKGIVYVSRCGRIYAMGPELAELWKTGRNGPKEVPQDKETSIRRLQSYGLVAVTEESGALARYRLLSECVICTEGRRFTDSLLPQSVQRLWAWLHDAGLRLTASELIRLEERQIKPTPALLGEDGRQRLTEMIYTTETIQDGILETMMEHSPVRDDTVDALLRLLVTGRIFLV